MKQFKDKKISVPKVAESKLITFNTDEVKIPQHDESCRLGTCSHKDCGPVDDNNLLLMKDKLIMAIISTWYKFYIREFQDIVAYDKLEIKFIFLVTGDAKYISHQPDALSERLFRLSGDDILKYVPLVMDILTHGKSNTTIQKRNKILRDNFGYTTDEIGTARWAIGGVGTIDSSILNNEVKEWVAFFGSTCKSVHAKLDVYKPPIIENRVIDYLVTIDFIKLASKNGADWTVLKALGNYYVEVNTDVFNNFFETLLKLFPINLDVPNVQRIDIRKVIEITSNFSNTSGLSIMFCFV